MCNVPVCAHTWTREDGVYVTVCVHTPRGTRGVQPWGQGESAWARVYARERGQVCACARTGAWGCVFMQAEGG